MQDYDFIIKLKNGDNHAFKEMVETHKDKVFNTCIGFLRNREDAEDSAQEVFMEVFNSIDSFNADAELSTWIYRIAVNKCLELIRYRKRKKRFGFFKGLMNQEETVDELEDTQMFVHPGIALENKERARILMAAIARLPKSQRIAFTLHKMEELSHKEIASVMKKSLSAVEALMHRAKTNLQDDLHAYYKSNED